MLRSNVFDEDRTREASRGDTHRFGARIDDEYSATFCCELLELVYVAPFC